MIITTNTHEIRALYTNDTIRVYQAYNRSIAEEAVRKGTFGEHFSMTRMTWIKPSFLWMMYRSGWAQKKDQEHILAIDIKKSGFDKAVSQAVISSFRDGCGLTREEWKKQIESSDVRIQWDPEKDIDGNDLPYRSIQLGLRRTAVDEYVNDWIVSVSDITDYVKELDILRRNGEDITDRLPAERVYIRQ